MAGGFRMEVISPDNLWNDVNGINKVVESVLDMAALDVQVDFNVTAQTWSRRPAFIIKKFTGEREIYTTNIIYKFLSGGTRVRYATMNPGYKSKTSVRWIGSRAGGGRVLFISRKHPRPGIKAREYPDTIIAKWRPLLPKLIQRAIDSQV